MRFAPLLVLLSAVVVICDRPPYHPRPGRLQGDDAELLRMLLEVEKEMKAEKTAEAEGKNGSHVFVGKCKYLD